MADYKRPGVIIYFDIEPAIEILNDAQLGKFFRAILEYAHYGVIQDFEDPLIKMAWTLIKPNMDRDQLRYEKTVQDNIVKGFKSDFKRNYAPKHNIDPNDEAAMDEYVRQRLAETVDRSQQQPTAVDQCRQTRTRTRTDNSNYNETRTTTLTSTGATTGATTGGMGGADGKDNNPPQQTPPKTRDEKITEFYAWMEATSK